MVVTLEESSIYLLLLLQPKFCCYCWQKYHNMSKILHCCCGIIVAGIAAGVCDRKNSPCGGSGYGNRNGGGEVKVNDRAKIRETVRDQVKIREIISIRLRDQIQTIIKKNAQRQTVKMIW
jgi:hypothetical protein